MFNIDKFLEKFSKNINSIESNKKLVLGTIEKYTQLKFKDSETEIKEYIVYLKSSPAAKNKIFIYKNKIIEDLNNSSIKIVDIR